MTAKNIERDYLNIGWGTLAMAALLALVAMFARAESAYAISSSALMHRVYAALRANDNLNGANCYTASAGVVVLYGTVFNKSDRALAQRTAAGVPGVTQVVNSLRTKTGDWIEEEERINNTLVLNDFQDVSVRVVGPDAYLSGTVTSNAEKQRAQNVVASVSKLKIDNVIWVKPPPLF
ncbi:MAG: BON domain-containing protein [Candidatus Binataceae bacterium]